MRRGCRRGAAGVLLAGLSGSRLSLCEVAGAALADEARGNKAGELGLDVGLTGASGVCESAAGLGDGVLEAGNSAVRLAGEVLGGNQAGEEEGDDRGLHGESFVLVLFSV